MSSLADEAASEELASEDIWGDEDADMGMEDESSRPAADSTEDAAPVPEVAAKQGVRSGARKRQSAAPAKGEKAPKRQRAQPKKAQVARKSTAAARPAAKAAPSKDTSARKAVQSRKRSKGAGSADADPPEPEEVSEAPSEVQAAKAMFMRTMGLPEPKAFSSSSRGTAKRPVQKAQPAVAQRRVKNVPAAGTPQQALGKATPRQTQAQAQPSPEGAKPALPLQQDAPEGPMQTDQQQAQPQLGLGQAHPKAAAPPDAAAPLSLRERREGVTQPAASQKAPQIPAAAAALGTSVPMSASPRLEAPQEAAEALRAGTTQPASEVDHQQAATEQSPQAKATPVGNVYAIGANQEHAKDLMAEQPERAQPGSNPVPASPDAPKLEQLLGGSGRPAENGVKLVNLLNPNNPQYNQAFAVEYARMKCAPCPNHPRSAAARIAQEGCCMSTKSASASIRQSASSGRQGKRMYLAAESKPSCCI